MIYPPRIKFNLDAAMRYEPLVQRFEKQKNNKVILEVGSGTNGISDFYLGKVIGVDPDFTKTQVHQNENIEHVKGSIHKLPFGDGKFENVICLDTFEHIYKNTREAAIIELLRVTKKGGKIYLGFPCGNLTKRYEKVINYLFKKSQGFEHPWLSEHLKFGLPEKEEIVKIVKKYSLKGENIEILNNTNLFLWLIIHVLFSVYYGSILSRILTRFYVPILYLSKINLPPFYRVILIIQK